MKPPAWRMNNALYPFRFDLQTRNRDEDGLRHINNIAIAGYYDEARGRFSRKIFNEAGMGEYVRIVTAESSVSYLGEVFHPDMVEIGTGILRIGNASYDLGQAMFQNGKCVGVCTSTFVQATAEGSSPLSASLRAVLSSYLIQAPTA
jgi:acyl-CoA thioester hydrolase